MHVCLHTDRVHTCCHTQSQSAPLKQFVSPLCYVGPWTLCTFCVTPLTDTGLAYGSVLTLFYVVGWLKLQIAGGWRTIGAVTGCCSLSRGVERGAAKQRLWCSVRTLWVIPAVRTRFGDISDIVVTICTASLTFNNSTFCPHTVFMCFVWIWKQTAIISLYNINWLVFITEI